MLDSRQASKSGVTPLLELYPPIHEWSPRRSPKIQSCVRRWSTLATNRPPLCSTRGAPRISFCSAHSVWVAGGRWPFAPFPFAMYNFMSFFERPHPGRHLACQCLPICNFLISRRSCRQNGQAPGRTARRNGRRCHQARGRIAHERAVRIAGQGEQVKVDRDWIAPGSLNPKSRPGHSISESRDRIPRTA